MRTDLYFQFAFDDYVALLAGMAGEFNIPVLGFLAVCCVNVKRLGDTVFELGGQVVVDHAVGLLYPLPFAVSGNRVIAQAGAGTLDYICHVYAQDQSAAIDKSEVQVASAFLAHYVLFKADTGLFRHIFP